MTPYHLHFPPSPSLWGRLAPSDSSATLRSSYRRHGRQCTVCVYVSWYRKGGQRAIDELQRTITEIEAKYKAELGRQRKKFETDIREYEIQVETLNRANAELGKNGKAASSRLKVQCTLFVMFSLAV